MEIAVYFGNGAR